MIDYVIGNLIETDRPIIMHGCNCFHTMGTGVARALSIRWPGVFEADRTSTIGDPSKLGTFTAYQVHNGPIVYNLYTQFRYGRKHRHTDYDAVRKSFQALTDDVLGRGIGDRRIATYRLGCVNGGGDWSVVSKIMEDVLCDFSITVYELSPDDEKQKILLAWRQLGNL